MDSQGTLANSFYSRPAWFGLGIFSAVVLIVIPLLRLLLPAENPLHLSDYYLLMIGKIMCYAIVAVAMDLIWGYAGILSLGHGLFFALGGYSMGMYLMREIGAEGQYRSNLPDFMVFLDWKEFPWYWAGSEYFYIGAIENLAGARFVGVRFRLVRLSLAHQRRLFLDHHPGADVCFHAAVFRNDTGFGGNNGFTDFKRIMGFSLAHPGTRVTLFAITGLVLILTLLLCRYIVTSKFGRVLAAIRDAESRTMFSGYNTRDYKLFAWTLSALLCGIAGALYVPQVGIINPSEMSPANSIEIAIWVAVGGRGTLAGAILGAAIVNGAKSYFTVAWPEFWLYFLGALFVVVTVYLPNGVIGLARRGDK